MGISLRMHKIDCPSKVGHGPVGWQPFGLDHPHIDSQHHIRTVHHIDIQDAKPPRLDHPADRGGTGRVKPPVAQRQDRPVVRYKPRPEGHQLQRQRGLARP